MDKQKLEQESDICNMLFDVVQGLYRGELIIL